MPLNFEDLSLTFPDRLWLKISSKLSQPFSEQDFSNELSYDNAVINQICLDAFLTWAKTNLDPNLTLSPWPSVEALPRYWEFVNGTAIALGNSRLVLIPSDASDTMDMSIPQEWVDIPQWCADYYVAVQVNQAEGWLQFWGYTSHQTLKAQADYSSIYRNYHLHRDFWITDLDLLWVAHALNFQEKQILPSLPELSDATTALLMDQLSQPLPYSPRLEIEFEQWSRILSEPNLQEQLYQRRLNASEAIPLSRSSQDLNRGDSISTSVINAALWFQDQMDQVAQALQWQLLPAHQSHREPIALRGSSHDLDVILAKLQTDGFHIPPSARCTEQSLMVSNQPMKLYALVWQILEAESLPEWCLLAVVTGTTGVPLTDGTSLMIQDETEIVAEIALETDPSKHYLCGAVSGNWHEKFQISVRLPDGATVTSPHIAFQPNVNA